MKQKLPIIISVFSCLLALLCMVRIVNLQNQLRSMENNLNNSILILRNDINNISSNVSYQLEEQDNLLSSNDFSFGLADWKNLTVELNCTITPKEFRPEETSVVLVCNGEEHPMTLRSGAYVATFPISMLEGSTITEVRFLENGNIRIQNMDWSIYPRDQYFPNLYTSFSGSGSGKKDSSTCTWTYNGTLYITAEQKGGLNSSIEALDLVQYNNGEEVTRSSFLGQDKDDNSVVFGQKKPAVTITNQDPLEVQYELQQDYTFPFGSTMELYVEMSDSRGFTYRALVGRLSASAEGEVNDDEQFVGWDNCYWILDENGQLLYSSPDDPAYY